MTSAADVPSKFDLAPAAVDLAWAAGFLDGEGCIHISKATTRGYTNYQLTLRVTQRTREPIDRFHDLFGGFIGHYAASRGPRKMQWVWGSSNKAAGDVLRLLIPHLIVKRTQAELAVEFQDMRSQARTRDPDTGRMVTVDKSPYEEFYSHMRALKAVV